MRYERRRPQGGSRGRSARLIVLIQFFAFAVYLLPRASEYFSSPGEVPFMTSSDEIFGCRTEDGLVRVIQRSSALWTSWTSSPDDEPEMRAADCSAALRRKARRHISPELNFPKTSSSDAQAFPASLPFLNSSMPVTPSFPGAAHVSAGMEAAAAPKDCVPLRETVSTIPGLNTLWMEDGTAAPAPSAETGECRLRKAEPGDEQRWLQPAKFPRKTEISPGSAAPENTGDQPALPPIHLLLEDFEIEAHWPLSAGLVLGLPIQINCLSEEDFSDISGIGTSTAERIVRDRSVRGDFSSLEDLKRVRGLGPWKLGIIRDAVGKNLSFAPCVSGRHRKMPSKDAI